MNRGFFIGGLVVAVLLGIGPATAQTPRVKLQLQPRVAPKVIMMPPARAGQLALKLNPGAKLLKIRPLPGKGYSVTIQRGGSVNNVLIPNTP